MIKKNIQNLWCYSFDHVYYATINIFKVRMGVNEYIWVYRHLITHKIGNISKGRAHTCMIWGPGWPGNFPEHHGVTHFAQKNETASKTHTKH